MGQYFSPSVRRLCLSGHRDTLTDSHVKVIIKHAIGSHYSLATYSRTWLRAAPTSGTWTCLTRRCWPRRAWTRWWRASPTWSPCPPAGVTTSPPPHTSCSQPGQYSVLNAVNTLSIWLFYIGYSWFQSDPSLSQCVRSTQRARFRRIKREVTRWITIINQKLQKIHNCCFSGIEINKFMFTSVARPTVGIKRTSIWNLRVRD